MSDLFKTKVVKVKMTTTEPTKNRNGKKGAPHRTEPKMVTAATAWLFNCFLARAQREAVCVIFTH